MAANNVEIWSTDGLKKWVGNSAMQSSFALLNLNPLIESAGRVPVINLWPLQGALRCLVFRPKRLVLIHSKLLYKEDRLHQSMFMRFSETYST